MKKLAKILFLALLGISACQQEMSDIRVDVTFIATSEQGTKTVLEGEKILWETGDEIKILWKEGATMSSARVGDDRAVAEFAASVDRSESYYAVHPYGVASSLSDGVITVGISEKQDGSFDDANITIAKSDADFNLSFKHVAAYVEFATEKSGIVEFSGSESDVLTGKVKIKGFDSDGRPKYQVENGTSKVRMEVREPGTYYFAVLPDVVLNGFTIRMITSEGSTSASYANKLVIGRGQLLPLGNITERLRVDGQIDSSNEKFIMDDVFENSDLPLYYIPNAVALGTELTDLPASISTLNLTVASDVPVTSIRMTSSEYLAGFFTMNPQSGERTMVQGSKSLTVNCSGMNQSSFTVPVKLLPAVGAVVDVRICDVNGRMSETSFRLNVNSGETASQTITHNPSPNILWFEGFDRCVWGGDIIDGKWGFSPVEGIPDKSVNGFELPVYEVPEDVAGSEMVHTTWHATKPVSETSDLNPEYLASRGFDEYRQLLRVQEHAGYVAVGTAVLYRGYVETMPMKNLGDLKSVDVRFKICPMPGCVETIIFEVAKAGVISSVTVDGEDKSAACWHKNITSRAMMDSDVVEVPVNVEDMRWHDVEVRVENVNETTIFSWYPASSDQKVNGFYLDEICVEKASGWDYNAGRDLRVLYWNIQNGMWADQGNNYDNFVSWVESYNPDVCVWTEAMTIYATGTSSAISSPILAASVSDGSKWKELARRYGHEYLAIAHRDGDDYPQVVTSRYPIKTLATFGRIILSDDIYHGAGLHQIDMDGTKINIITLHLKPNLDGKDNSDYRKFEVDYVFRRSILKADYANENYIVAGDFNARTPWDAAYYTGATDKEYAVHQYVFDNTNLVDIIGSRYPNRFLTTTVGSRIDFVYMSESMNSKVTDAAVVSDAWVKADLPVSESVASFRMPSDHRPILVNVRLK